MKQATKNKVTNLKSKVKTVIKAKSAVKVKPAMKATVRASVKPKATKPKNDNTKTLTVGSKVPEFSMPSTILGTVSAASLKGKPYVLYFYPKDDTPGCTVEACGFRDALPKFNKLKVNVIGVSKDSLSSHEKFSKKFKLSFALASDEKSNVCETFGVWTNKSMYGRSYKGIERTTFLIDSKGVVNSVWNKVSVPGHVDEVKKALENLK